ncbi:MAG: hydrogenase expression/formation protein HypE [Candidatus Micrarchaeota archaeon]|nr:hydrogenase expression/formation protein HypE [Candidatus Micrarchaeota archaeon]
MEEERKGFPSACPAPSAGREHILLAHGGGGRLMSSLVEKLFLPVFGSRQLGARHDGAVVEAGGRLLAFTTDSYVVRPLFFPGGDIGKLAVNGTANDLAMCGAKPLYISAAFILEEGLPIETLSKVVSSMQEAASAAGVSIVTGDTKVVDKGKGDGMFVNTAGIGVIEHALSIEPASIQPGDAILLSGDIGRHGTAIMAVREGLQFESTIESDCACVAGLVGELLEAGVEIHCMRDLTRGGLGCALVEIAETAKRGIKIEEASIPVAEEVRGACEMLGLDAIYVANEGRFIAFVPEKDSAKALDIMRAHPLGRSASKIGKVAEGSAGLVTLKSAVGTSRIIDMPSGEQLPRIC